MAETFAERQRRIARERSAALRVQVEDENRRLQSEREDRASRSSQLGRSGDLPATGPVLTDEDVRIFTGDRVPSVTGATQPAEDRISRALLGTSLTQAERAAKAGALVKEIPKIPQIQRAREARQRGDLVAAVRLESEAAGIAERNVKALIAAEQKRETRIASERELVSQAVDRATQGRAVQRAVTKRTSKIQEALRKEREQAAERIDQLGGLGEAVAVNAVSRGEARSLGFTDAQISEAVNNATDRGRAQIAYDKAVRGSVAVAGGGRVARADFEALPSEDKTFLRQRGISQYNERVEARNAELAVLRQQLASETIDIKGQLVPLDVYNALSSSDQSLLRRQGVDLFNRSVERRNEQAQQAFEKNTVELATGERVDRAAFEKLTDDQQRRLKAEGLVAFGIEQTGNAISASELNSLVGQETKRLQQEATAKLQRGEDPGVTARDAVRKQARANVVQRLRAEGVQVGSARAGAKAVGELLVSLTPIVGTAVYWNRMSTPEKALSVLGDVLVVGSLARVGKVALSGAAQAGRQTLTGGVSNAERLSVKRAIDVQVRGANAAARGVPAPLRAPTRKYADAIAELTRATHERKVLEQTLRGTVRRSPPRPGTALEPALQRAKQSERLLQARLEEAAEQYARSFRSAFKGGDEPLVTRMLDPYGAKARISEIDRLTDLTSAKKLQRVSTAEKRLRSAEQSLGKVVNAREKTGGRWQPTPALSDAQALVSQRRAELAAAQTGQISRLTQESKALARNIKALEQLGRSPSQDLTDLAEAYKYRRIGDLPRAISEYEDVQRQIRARYLTMRPMSAGPGDKPSAGFTGGPQTWQARRGIATQAPPSAPGASQTVLGTSTKGGAAISPAMANSATIVKASSADLSAAVRAQAKSQPGLAAVLTPQQRAALELQESPQPKTSALLVPLKSPKGKTTTSVHRAALPELVPRAGVRERPRIVPKISGVPGPVSVPTIGTSPEPQPEPSVDPEPVPTPASKISGEPDADTTPGISGASEPDTVPKIVPAGKESTRTTSGDRVERREGGREESGRRRGRGFQLPTGGRLEPGVWPERVRFKLGPFWHELNMTTGERDIRAARTPGTPEQTFTVLSTTNKRPVFRRYDQGAFEYSVREDGIRFVPEKVRNLFRPRTGRRSRPFVSRMR